MLHYQNPIAVAAHRGNSMYFPDNTMAAFRSAAELPIDMIEIDLHMTKDGELILMHDHTVDRTTNGSGLIREKRWKRSESSTQAVGKAKRFRVKKYPPSGNFSPLCAPIRIFY